MIEAAGFKRVDAYGDERQYRGAARRVEALAHGAAAHSSG